jgi:ribonuclease HII
VLVDARTIPEIPMPQNAFNKGDGLNFSIAAASIIAKTTRDAMMTELDRKYPGYGFAAHKGYPVPEHKAAILKLGVCEIHRMSFPAIHELQGEFSEAFYSMRTQCFAAENRDALAAVEAAFKTKRDVLEEREGQQAEAHHLPALEGHRLIGIPIVDNRRLRRPLMEVIHTAIFPLKTSCERECAA